MVFVKFVCGNSFCGKCVGWVRKFYEGWIVGEKFVVIGYRK